MAVCLDYQAVYLRRRPIVVSAQLQLLAAVLLLGALTLKVWIKMESTNSGYRLAELRENTIRLDMERQELELQISILTKPNNLREMAESRLNLMPLDPKQAWKVE